MKFFRPLSLMLALFITPFVNAEDLTSIEVKSSILSNSITENKQRLLFYTKKCS